MKSFICHQCGSQQSTISDTRPKDFPSKYYFVQCADCQATLGVVDFFDVMDRSRRGSIQQRNLANELMAMRFGDIENPESKASERKDM